MSVELHDGFKAIWWISRCNSSETIPELPVQQHPCQLKLQPLLLGPCIIVPDPRTEYIHCAMILKSVHMERQIFYKRTFYSTVDLHYPLWLIESYFPWRYNVWYVRKDTMTKWTTRNNRHIIIRGISGNEKRHGSGGSCINKQNIHVYWISY